MQSPAQLQEEQVLVSHMSAFPLFCRGRHMIRHKTQSTYQGAMMTCISGIVRSVESLYLRACVSKMTCYECKRKDLGGGGTPLLIL